MGRTLRTVRAGEQSLAVSVASGTTGTARVPNYGVTLVSSATDTMVVMDAPVEGVEKTLFCVTFATTGATVTVNLSTAETVTIGGSTGATAIQFSGESSNGGSVTLVGRNSTEWFVKSLYNAGSTALISITTAAA